MATIKIKWRVEELANVLSQFNTQKVYRSTTGISGVYSELTIPSNRVDLISGVTEYYFDDINGDASYYYKVTFFNSSTSNESTASDPISGSTALALSIISVEELKEIYLFGLDLTDDSGNPIPDSVYEHYIKSAVTRLEKTLDIRLLPITISKEPHDYIREEFLQFMYLFLYEYPVISVEGMTLEFPTNNTIMTVDLADIHLRKESGQLQVVPNLNSNYAFIFTNSSFGVLPYYQLFTRAIPDFFRVSYTAGLDPIPDDVKDLIGKIASFGPLNIAGDLIGGAGIASQSLSIDGLSQMINTTSSATNAGYGARLLQYGREIKEVIPELRRYYKGLRMVVV
jgi:hypothetical protein